MNRVVALLLCCLGWAQAAETVEVQAKKYLPQQWVQTKAEALQLAEQNRRRELAEQCALFQVEHPEYQDHSCDELGYRLGTYANPTAFDGKPVFYHCLAKLQELNDADLKRYDGATCEALGVSTGGLKSKIVLYPWTPERYQLTVQAPSGARRRWPEREMPTLEQQQRLDVRRKFRHKLLDASIAVILLGLLTHLPRIPYLDVLFALGGLLLLYLIVPTLGREPNIGDAIGLYYLYYFLVIVALLGSSLFLPYAAYWRGRLPLWSSLGMAFFYGFWCTVMGGYLLVWPASWWVYLLVGVLLAGWILVKQRMNNSRPLQDVS